MLKEIEAAGKTIEEAKENARAALGAGPLDDVTFEILYLGSKGIFGIGAKPARIKATIEVEDAPQPRRERRRGDKNDRPKSAVTEGEKPQQGGERRGKGGKRRDNRRSERTEDKAVAHEEVIPEESLKMERREVAEGEDMSYDFVRTLVGDIGLDASVELYACEDGTRRITVVGNQASLLIGHHGETLDALQYLANLASARKNANGERDKSRVTVDIEGYRAKRERTLRELARRMAAKALRNKRSVMLEPMSAYERRIIHSEVQGIEGVSTNSVGADNNRKIVIYLTDKKPEGIFEEDEETRTSLKEEFAPDENDVVANAGAIEQSAVSDLDLDYETVGVHTTHPADDLGDDGDDIK